MKRLALWGAFVGCLWLWACTQGEQITSGARARTGGSAGTIGDASVIDDASAGAGGNETGGTAAGDGGGAGAGGSNDTGGVAANGGSAGADGGGTGGAGTGGSGTGGSGTGGAGTGGSAGAAGCSSGTGGSADACLLIDDMEDGNTTILANCTRSGYWSANKDPTGGTQSAMVMDPIAGGRCGSTRAAHTVTSGLVGYGASIAFDVHGGTTYDVGAYKGIMFAIVNTYGAATVNVGFPNVDTHPSGGRCGVNGSAQCWDNWQKTVNVTSTWTAVTVLWSELRQSGWGYTTATFDKNIFTVNFGFGTATVNLWVDDVYFVP